jgi:hypothetical protein
VVAAATRHVGGDSLDHGGVAPCNGDGLDGLGRGGGAGADPRTSHVTRTRRARATPHAYASRRPVGAAAGRRAAGALDWARRAALRGLQ